MATFEESVQEQEQLRNEIKWEIEARLRSGSERLAEKILATDGGRFFEPLRGELARLEATFRRALEVDLDLVPYRTLVRLNRATARVAQATVAMAQFAPLSQGVGPPRNAREEIANEFARAATLVSIVLALAQPARKPSPSVAEIEERRSQIDNLYSEASGLLGSIRVAEKDAVSALSTVRGTAAGVGAERYAKYFREEASSCDTSAKKWLRATVFLGVVAAGVPVASILIANGWCPRLFPDLSKGRNLQFLLSKLALFSVVSWAAYSCFRTYRANLHNAVVNRHRSNALKTYHVFVEASDEPAVKQAVLLQVTTSIFAPQPSGFISAEADASLVSPVAQIARQIVSGKTN